MLAEIPIRRLRQVLCLTRHDVAEEGGDGEPHPKQGNMQERLAFSARV